MKERKSINFSGSNTHIFGMLWPWVTILCTIILHKTKAIDILETPILLVIGIALIPVIVTVILFFIINKGIHAK